MKKSQSLCSTPAFPKKHYKDTYNFGSDTNLEERYCLWIDQDTGEVKVVPTSIPIEKVPFGFYVPYYVGTRSQMEIKRRQIILARIKPPKRYDRKPKI